MTGHLDRITTAEDAFAAGYLDPAEQPALTADEIERTALQARQHIPAAPQKGADAA